MYVKFSLILIFNSSFLNFIKISQNITKRQGYTVKLCIKTKTSPFNNNACTYKNKYYIN